MKYATVRLRRKATPNRTDTGLGVYEFFAPYAWQSKARGLKAGRFPRREAPTQLWRAYGAKNRFRWRRLKYASGAVHWYDEARGGYTDIDLSLTDKLEPRYADFAYRSASNSWTAYFADMKPERPAVLLESHDASIGFTYLPTDPSVAPIAETRADKSFPLAEELDGENNYVVYSDVESGVDILYRVGIASVKEEIVIGAPNGVNKFRFLITLSNVEPKRAENGGWEFIDGEGRPVFGTAGLVMYDADGDSSDRLTFDMEPRGNGEWLGTLSVDKAFLDSPDTRYPVVVDPTFTVTGPSDTFDTFVSQKNSGTNYYTNTNLRTGYDSSYYDRYTFIRFDLPSGVTSAAISSAKLKLRLRANETGINPFIEASTTAYRVAANWTPSTLTWSNKPTVSSTATCDWPTMISDWHIIPMTSLVKAWYTAASGQDDGYNNYGVCVRERTKDTGLDDWYNFYSSDYTSNTSRRPCLEIITGDINYSSILPVDAQARAYFGSDWQSDVNDILEEADDTLYSLFDIDFYGKTYFSWTSPFSTCPSPLYSDYCFCCSCDLPNCSGCDCDDVCEVEFCDHHNASTPLNEGCRYLHNVANLYNKGCLEDVLEDCGQQSKSFMAAFTQASRLQYYEGTKAASISGLGLRESSYIISDADTFDNTSDRAVVLLHEFGHIMGCDHCTGVCIMNYVNGVFSSTNKFCNACKAIINKHK